MANIQTLTMNKRSTRKIRTFPHPVDSGWSWMVLLGTFTIFVTFGGILRSFGIYMVEFLSVYDTNSTATSTIIGLQFASSGFAAIICMTVGLKVLTPRQLIIIGGVVGSVGLLINMFAQSIFFFIFSHSILVGTALGLYNGPSLYSLGKYFDKKRSLANGVTMSGVSFGGLIMGPLSRYLIDQYGLKGAFLIIGGIHLNTIVAGALIRPDTFYQFVIKKKRSRTISDTKNPARNVEERTRKISSERNADNRTRKISDERNTDQKNQNVGTENKTRKISEDRITLIDQRNRNPSRERNGESNARTRKISEDNQKHVDQRRRKISEYRPPETRSLLEDNNDQPPFEAFRPRSPTGDSFSPLARKAMLQRMRSRTESEVIMLEIDPSLHEKHDTISSSQGDIPAQLSQEKKKRLHYISNEFVFNILSAELVRSLSEEKINKLANGTSSSDTTFVNKNSFKTLLKLVFNCAVFRNTAFTIFLIAYLIGSIGCFYPIIYIPALGDSYGISKIQTSLLVSVSSAVDILGRTLSGIIADKAFISRKQVMIIALIICGISNCLNSFYIEFWSLGLYSVIYGLVGGTMFAINTSTLSEIIAPEKAGQAVGLMVGLQQLCLGLAGPISGALRDLTGTYSASFYFFGIGNVVAACLLFIDIICLNYTKTKPTAEQSIELSIR